MYQMLSETCRRASSSWFKLPPINSPVHFKIAFSCLCFTKLLTWVYGETQNLKCTKSVFLGQSQSNLALESGENCGGGVEWLVFFFFWLWGRMYWFCLIFFFIIPKYNLHKKHRLDSVTTTDHRCLGLKWSEELIEVIKSFPRDKFPLWLGPFHSPNMRCLGKAPFLECTLFE